MLPFQPAALINPPDSKNGPRPTILGLELGMTREEVIKIIGMPLKKGTELLSDKENSKIHNETWFYKGFKIEFQNLIRRDTIELSNIVILSKDIPLEFDIKLGTSYQMAKSKLVKRFKIYSEDTNSVQFEFSYGKFMGGIIELESMNGLIKKIQVCRNDD